MKRLKAKDIIFVGLQAILILLYFLAPFDYKWRLPFWIRLLALLISLAGVLLAVLAVLQLKKSLSPFPTPVRNGDLITNGVYKIARHPVYTGLILFFAGYAIYFESTLKLLLSALLFVLFWFKSTYEEKLLSDKFHQYREYKKRTHRFFP